MEGDKGPVCVTGGTGYVASWLIMRLLQLGYSVHATARLDPEYKRDISYLTNLPGASERLRIFSADLNRLDSFDAAIEGCTGVFHVAHPMDVFGNEPEETVSRRSVQGTLAILKACLNSKTVKRVVHTSSSVTCMFNRKDQGETEESIWTNIDFYRSLGPSTSAYVCSKTKTERAALEFAENHGLDLVTLVLPLTFGPFICPNPPSSVHIGLAMILGRENYYSILTKASFVHVDDVASAHIFLLDYPNAKGRYICSSNEITLHKMSEFLSAKYPEFQMPTADILDKVKGYMLPSLSSKKLLDSGFRFKYGLDEMFEGAIQCFRERGFL
ncbi:vestitone reductase-like [Cornus florida]|uniref:vestitone reductase-like n=1 Tax=Cornus florida TaxID=4283 RepID=UPI00289DCC8C|nr:vestitone reductase-like [Cornus florida]